MDRHAGAKCHLVAIRGFYYYLQDHQVASLFSAITKKRDLAMFMLMLRCGLRVEEVANLALGAIDYGRNQIMVRCGKGAKDKIVFINIDTADALAEYLQIRQSAPEKRIFLVEKGAYKGKPISVRGIQKRIEYYSKKSGTTVT